MLDDLREIVDRSCEAAHKGDSPDSIAAYLWSNISAHLDQARKEERERIAETFAAWATVSENTEGGASYALAYRACEYHVRCLPAALAEQEEG